MKIESLNMNLKSLKSRVNNEKCCLFKGKITKSYTTFNENKANFKNIKICVSSFETSKYEILPAWRSKNQTQFKPKMNPIAEKAIIKISSLLTSKYEKNGCWRAKKQSQNKPNFKGRCAALAR